MYLVTFETEKGEWKAEPEVCKSRAAADKFADAMRDALVSGNVIRIYRLDCQAVVRREPKSAAEAAGSGLVQTAFKRQ